MLLVKSFQKTFLEKDICHLAKRAFSVSSTIKSLMTILLVKELEQVTVLMAVKVITHNLKLCKPTFPGLQP